MSDRKYKIFALITMLALCSHGLAIGASSTPDPCTLSSEKIRSERLEKLSKDLELASHAGSERRTQLRKIRKALRDSSDTGEKLIDSYAFILQIASLINAGDYALARTQLRSVPLSHPKAVTAGLLMAESYRLEGDTSAARAWFLRVASTFPHHLEAQQGLLSAALDAEHDGQVDLARSLLQRSAELAEASAALANGLALDNDREKADLLFARPEDIPPPIYRNFQQSLLSEEPEIAALLSQIRAVRQQHDCIKRNLQATRGQQAALAQAQALYQQQRNAVFEAIAQRKEKIDTLKQQIQPGVLDQKQVSLRKEIRAQENLLIREQIALASVEQNLQAAGQMALSAEHELSAMKEEFKRRWGEDMGTVLDALDRSAQRTIGAYRDTAGLAYQNMGEISSH